MLPSWMNEIPFAQNIMRVCVRTASRLVESLAPVNKKTWTVSFNVKWRLNSEIIYFMLILALVRLLLPAVTALPWCTFMSEKYIALFFSVSFTVCTKLFIKLETVLFRAVLALCVTNDSCIYVEKTITTIMQWSFGKWCSLLQKSGWFVIF